MAEGTIALVFSGGVALGAYHGGVYESLSKAGLEPDWIAGSSIGAVTGALIAGTKAENRLQTLRTFWRADFGVTQQRPSAWRHWRNWASALEARVIGVPGHFRPRFSPPSEAFSSFYDLAPMRDRLKQLLDFERLNNGPRFCVATTDIETGDLVLFDTGKGDRITVDHLLASCGYLPEFAPIQIGDRFLGDGGLSANAPLEAVLGSDPPEQLVCFIVDLYARDGARPTTVETAFARRSDLNFGNQTWQRLQSHLREMALRAKAGEAPRRQKILYLSYRASADEAGPEKLFDYSLRSIGARWKTGMADGEEAVKRCAGAIGDGPVLEVIRRSSPGFA